MANTAQDILIRFMQARLDAKAQGREWLGQTNAQIREVKLTEDFDAGWSEYTPGEGWLLVIEAVDAADRIVYTETHAGEQTPKFINELCRFAAELVS